MLTKIFIVGLGGGVGSVFRYLTSVYVARRHEGLFPLPIFLVNVAGCLLIGILIGLSGRALNENARLLLIPGFCGGYTTFSTFAAENFNLLQTGNYATLAAYIVLSVVVGIVAVWAGMQLAEAVV